MSIQKSEVILSIFGLDASFQRAVHEKKSFELKNSLEIKDRSPHNSVTIYGLASKSLKYVELTLFPQVK